ncbi:hypothetical protein SISNIDRAFT_469554 [Sistotremastrum niveocremeum HHB9708]|uniref:Uncharacterized protein n=1 Tax=Sistotremastrum niveocremeum HHB9708 TaxID=1314777 RepID=A0A164PUB1_9AGAM|nr:hypothetical protein SISNIDRAFT_469554 [Sistotremastrum niveocremeum HHB9708]
MPHPPAHHYQKADNPYPPPAPVYKVITDFSVGRLVERARGYYARGVNDLRTYHEYVFDFFPLAERVFAYGGVDHRRITQIFFEAFHEPYREHIRDALGCQTFTNQFRAIPLIHHFIKSGVKAFPPIAREYPVEQNLTTMRQFPPTEVTLDADTARAIQYEVDRIFTSLMYSPRMAREHITEFRSRIFDFLEEKAQWDASVNEILTLNTTLGPVDSITFLQEQQILHSSATLATEAASTSSTSSGSSGVSHDVTPLTGLPSPRQIEVMLTLTDD